MVKNQLLASGLAKAAASEAQVAARGFRIQISEKGFGGNACRPTGTRRPTEAANGILPPLGEPKCMGGGSCGLESGVGGSGVSHLIFIWNHVFH